MILDPLLAAAVWQLSLCPPAMADTLKAVPLPSAPTFDGTVTEREYGVPALQFTTAVGVARVWMGRHDDYLYIAAVLPDSTVDWSDDFVVSLDPLGRGDASPNGGDRQWYLRRILDKSVVVVAQPDGWYSSGHRPTVLGATRHHPDWDIASTSSSAGWMVELRIRLNVVKPGPGAPRIAFRTYNNQPSGWWSWPMPPDGVPPQHVEQRPDLWIPLRLM
jgi:hypothetical protein